MRLGRLLFLPVFAFLLIFAIIPAFGVLSSSLTGAHGLSFTFYRQTFSQQYYNAFWTTTWLSLSSSVLAAIWGFVIAFALVRSSMTVLQRIITALSSTMANFAGLPLAVAFMATLGTSGILTVFLQQYFHVDIVAMGFNLAAFSGLFLAYLSFLTPLAVILMLPAVSSLHQEWEEAMYTLGASFFLYLRKVAVPVLLPSMIGTLGLLFANAFSTYVTSYELAGSSINLVPILIGYMVNGNVSMNLGLGDALSMEEMIVLGVSISFYFFAQRKSLLHAREGRSANAT